VNARHVLSVALCVLFFALGSGLALHTCDWSFATRSGTLIVVTAVLLEAWPLLTTAKADNLLMWTSQESHTAVRISIVVVCIGTLVQGWGDFVVRLLLSCA